MIDVEVMSQLVGSLVQRSTYQSILRAVRLTAVSHTLALIRGSTRRTFRHLTERRVNHYAVAFDRARGVGPRCQANGDPLSDSSADAGGQISDFGVATHAETLRMVNSYTVLRSIERARISPRRERFRMNQPIPPRATANQCKPLRAMRIMLLSQFGRPEMQTISPNFSTGWVYLDDSDVYQCIQRIPLRLRKVRYIVI
jgi:hypothetical protein